MCVSACKRHLIKQRQQMQRLVGKTAAKSVMVAAGAGAGRDVTVELPAIRPDSKTITSSASEAAKPVPTKSMKLKPSPPKYAKPTLFKAVITPLIDAIKAGHSQEVYALARSKKHCQERDAYGMTPLMWAIKKGSMGYIKACLDGGASVNDRDYKGNTPKTLAQTCGSFAIVKMFKPGNLMAKGYVY